MEKVEFTICIIAILISVCLCVDQSGSRRASDILSVGFDNPPPQANKPGISPISLSYPGYAPSTSTPRSTTFSYSNVARGGSGQPVTSTNTALPNNVQNWPQLPQSNPQPRPVAHAPNTPATNNAGNWPQLPQRNPQPRPNFNQPNNRAQTPTQHIGQTQPNGRIQPNTQTRSSGQIQPNTQTRPNGQIPPNTQTRPNGQTPPFSYSSALSGSNNNNRPQPSSPVNTNLPISSTNNPNKQTDLKPNEQNKQNKQDEQNIATDVEIEELSETLLRKDTNNAAKYVSANYQGRTTSGATSDEAPLPLLTVNQSAYDITTISLMRPLFNNYILDTSVNEHVTAQERAEESALLDAMLSTSVMRQLMNFFIEKGLVTRDPKTHKDLLKTIWFNLYSRGGGKIGSSAFEHVFLSELKNGEISGLHNWVYFSDEEMANHVNYMGYMRKVELGQKGSVLKLRFTLNNVRKPVNSIFIGTSPELEMALYTLCFMTRPDKVCSISLNNQKINIRTYTFRYRGKKMIGSAFPEI